MRPRRPGGRKLRAAFAEQRPSLQLPEVVCLPPEDSQATRSGPGRGHCHRPCPWFSGQHSRKAQASFQLDFRSTES